MWPRLPVLLGVCLVFCTGCSASAATAESPPVATQLSFQDGQANTQTHEIRAQQLLVRGMTRAYLEDYETAITMYEEALRHTPNEATLLAALAEAHMALEDGTTALFYAQQARDQEPGNVYYHQQLARIHLRNGDTQHAITTYSALLDQFPGHIDTLYELARLQAGTGQYAEAIVTFEDLLDRTGGDPSLLNQTLQLYLRVGDEEGVERTLKALMRFEPDNANYLRMLGELYVRQENLEEAALLFETALEREPNDIEMALSLANLYRLRGEQEKAEALLDRSMQNEDVSATQLVSQAAPYFARAATDQEAARAAAMLLERALEQEPDHEEALFMLGELHYRVGNLREAGERLVQALNQNPRVMQQWLLAASAFLEAGEPARAAEVAEEALLLFPGQLDLLFVAGYGLMNAYQNDDAINRFEETLVALEEAQPANNQGRAEAYAGLGLLYARKNDDAASDSLYALALEANPNHALVLNNFAYSLAERDTRLPDALSMADRAVALDSENPSFLDTLGWIHFKMGNLEEAKKWIGKSVETGQASAAVLEHYGDIHASMGDLEGARRYWMMALEKSPNNPSLLEKLGKD